MDDDIFSAALSLEDNYYTEGFTQGTSDGTKAGLYEGRHFGLAQAYSKFRSLGQLHGRAIVWNARCTAVASEKSAQKPVQAPPRPEITENSEDVESSNPPSSSRIFLPQVFSASYSTETHDEAMDPIDPAIEPPEFLKDAPQSWLGYAPSLPARTQKHVTTLYALTEPESLALENTEDAVSDLEDRSKRAVAKAGLVGRMMGEKVDGLGVGEDVSTGERLYAGASTGEGEVEDIAVKGEKVGKKQVEDKAETGQEVDYGELEIEIH